MESSTLKRIERLVATGAVIVIWQLVTVSVSFYFIKQVFVLGPNDPPAPYQHWEVYTFDNGGDLLGKFWLILWSQVLGLALAMVIVAIFYGLYKLGERIWFGPAIKKKPICKDPNCTCTWHQNEVFKSGRWRIQECVDPDCTCVERHAYETFSTGTKSWVPA